MSIYPDKTRHILLIYFTTFDQKKTKRMNSRLPGLLILLPLLLVFANSSAQEANDEFAFDDKPLDERIIHPEWFKLSFLELYDDLQDAIADGKRGLIIYFGQQDCAYCQAHLKNNWGRDDIRRYTQKYFNVIAIDVRGDRPVTDLDGIIHSEKQFAAAKKTNFTPSFLFLDGDGKVALKLSGYHPPYQFQAALEFVADLHYKKESFRQYLARAEAAFAHGNEGLNQDDAFSQPPYALDRTRFAATAPLLVMFEQGKCHACDVLHAGPLRDKVIREKLKKLEVVQLDMWSDRPVLTPGGEKTTARDWAQKLGIYYSPTMVFFDEQGEEVIRVDSVVRFYRLNNVMEYILSGGYRNYPTFQRWRREFKKEDAPQG
jgi:thioredoxin-related protein